MKCLDLSPDYHHVWVSDYLDNDHATPTSSRRRGGKSKREGRARGYAPLTRPLPQHPRKRDVRLGGGEQFYSEPRPEAASRTETPPWPQMAPASTRERLRAWQGMEKQTRAAGNPRLTSKTVGLREAF